MKNGQGFFPGQTGQCVGYALAFPPVWSWQSETSHLLLKWMKKRTENFHTEILEIKWYLLSYIARFWRVCTCQLIKQVSTYNLLVSTLLLSSENGDMFPKFKQLHCSILLNDLKQLHCFLESNQGCDRLFPSSGKKLVAALQLTNVKNIFLYGLKKSSFQNKSLIAFSAERSWVCFWQYMILLSCQDILF